MICIAGKNEIGVEALRQIALDHDNVVCLPNPGDRGEDDWQPSLRRAAYQLGIPIIKLDSLYSEPKLCFVSLEYSEIIKPNLFASDKLFNVHFSLLPKYRGCNTSIWPILNGEHEHGVSLHLIDSGIDTGPVIDQRAFALDGLTAYDAYMICQRLGLGLILEWLPRLLSGNFVTVAQGEGSTFPRKALDYSMKEITLSDGVETILRKVRAFTFPAYQRPSLDGRTILKAASEHFPDSVAIPVSDGLVYIKFES